MAVDGSAAYAERYRWTVSTIVLVLGCLRATSRRGFLIAIASLKLRTQRADSPHRGRRHRGDSLAWLMNGGSVILHRPGEHLAQPRRATSTSRITPAAGQREDLGVLHWVAGHARIVMMLHICRSS